MKKLFLTGIAALFLATGTAHAQTEPSPETLAAAKAALADALRKLSGPILPPLSKPPPDRLGPAVLHPGRPWEAERMPIFMTGRDGPMTPKAFHALFGRIGERAIPVHPHMLRHGCGYALANAGHDTGALQAWLGHKKHPAHRALHRAGAG